MKPLHVVTPLWDSQPLTDALGTSVLLKMEAFQPTASFKLRGIGRACQESFLAGARRFIASSGGNAGLAVAYAGRKMGVPVTVFVPESTPLRMREIIRKEKAEVLEHGNSWDDTHAHASDLAVRQGSAYLHPFDDSRIWKGHSTLIEEVASANFTPGAVVLSVGGGGLLCGVLEGLHGLGWSDVPVLAVETHGTASFAASVAAGRLVTLDGITSVATTLGARTVAHEALSWTQRHPIIPWTVSDRDAIDACIRFANDHRILVEPACGAALSAVYQRAAPLRDLRDVMVIVCGGAGINLDLLRSWDNQVPSGT